MPRNITVTFDDGSTHVYQQAPDNITPDQVSARAQKDFGKSVVSLDGGRSAASEAGSQLNQIPRQLGLTARYAIEGIAGVPEMVTEPIRQNITDPLLRYFNKPGVSDLVTGKKAPQGRPLSQEGAALADWMGLPKPEDGNERVIGDMSRLVAGSGAMSGAASLASKVLRSGGVAQAVAKSMASNPGQQAISAAGAAGAGGASREAGGDPLTQTVASVVGGIAAPTMASMGARAARVTGNAIANKFAPSYVNQNVEQNIELTLRRAGIDWSGLDGSTKAALRDEAKKAIQTGGELSADALRRFIDFKRVGATPTLGSLMLDPVQITRERNLAKMGANSSESGLQELARVENRNNNAFIGNLNDVGAARAPDAISTGEQLIGSLQSRDAAARQKIGYLYSQARDSAGRSAELDGATFTQRANQLLQQNLAGKLPGHIESALNDIASGKVPLTVDHAEQLKTVLARIQRNTSDGNERYSMGLIRQALEETPLRGSAAGQQSIDAFNAARSANRSYMGELERNPALAAAVDGAAPDNFFSKFVVRGNAGDVQALRDAIKPQRLNPQNLPATAEQIKALPPAQTEQALTATKNAIADYLKQKALGGAADEVGNFSQSAYNKALKEIGDRKLALFFTQDEIGQMKALGRVSSYTQFQPRGSAVNNSNSGALMLGRGLDFLASVGSKIPLGLSDTITGKINGMQARQALNVPKGLLAQQPVLPLSEKLGAQMLPGGLLAIPYMSNDR